MRDKKTIIMVLHAAEYIRSLEPDQLVTIPKIGQEVTSRVG